LSNCTSPDKSRIQSKSPRETQTLLPISKPIASLSASNVPIVSSSPKIIELKHDEGKIIKNKPIVLSGRWVLREWRMMAALTLPDVIIELSSDIEAVHLEVTSSLAINSNSQLKIAQNDVIDLADA
jgi:hypothetical protein